MRVSLDLRQPATLAAPRRLTRARPALDIEDCKLQAQRACFGELCRQYAHRKLSLNACKMLLAELDIDCCPSIYRGAHKRDWYIWSDYEQKRYTFAQWEEMTAREMGLIGEEEAE